MIKKILAYLKRLFQKFNSVSDVVTFFEKEIRELVANTLNKYWTVGNLTLIADEIVEGIVRILPAKYRQHIETICDYFVGRTIEDIDFDSTQDEAVEYVISKLKRL